MKKCRVLLLLLAGFSLLVAVSQPALADDEPTIAKDSVQVTARTNNVYHKNYDVWSWVPQVEFRVNGPIASGSQLYAEFTLPGSGPWVKFDCATGETQKGYWWKTNCGGVDIPEEKSVTYTGPVNFTIHLRNELAGTNATLFTGKLKAAKAHSNVKGPKFANTWVYYVDHDWNLPIGYIYLVSAGGSAGWNLPVFNVAFWVRGEINSPLEPHLFFQGKEVGKQFFQGDEVGRPSCGAEVEYGTTQSVDEGTPQKAKWQRVKCDFSNVRGWDKTGEKHSGPFEPPFLLSANPGNYEFKVLWKGHLARSLKFTVAPDGKLDNGIASANKLGSDRAIVPVQVIGDQDGVWDRTAWKTWAFYGNPLTGFTAPQ